MSETDFDQRILCPDGSCTGLIGPDGTCKVCGTVMPNWGDERKRGLQDEPEELDDEEDEDDEDDDELEDEDEGGDESGESEWDDRKLCDDGDCVGVIGTDGICSVCGKKSAA